MRTSETDLLERADSVRHARAMVALIAGALIVQGLLRLWIAGNLLISQGIEGQFGGLVHWRVFDGFAGWIALMILAMGDARAESTASRCCRMVMRWALGCGVLAFGASLCLGEVSGRAIVEIFVAGVLAIAALVVAGRQILSLAKAAGIGGLNVEQLWRAVAAQWVLLWIGAEVELRARFWREGVEAEEMARTLLFLLPVVGVGVNVMMAMGIRWWGMMRGADEGRPRVRAWVVSMVMVNAGAILVATGAVWARGLGVIGAAVMCVGVALYMVGFPWHAWRRGGAMVVIAFALLIVGLGMRGGELLMERNSVPVLYGAAWRHLLASVEVLWLAGMGGLALRRVVEERIAKSSFAAASIAAWMILAGVIVTAGIFVLAMWDREMVRGLFVGAGLQLAGLVVGAAVALRGGKGIRQE